MKVEAIKLPNGKIQVLSNSYNLKGEIFESESKLRERLSSLTVNESVSNDFDVDILESING